MVLEKTLESPLDSKEIKPELSLEGLMLKLKLQYFGHLIRRADSLDKTLMLGKTDGKRRAGSRCFCVSLSVCVSLCCLSVFASLS